MEIIQNWILDHRKEVKKCPETTAEVSMSLTFFPLRYGVSKCCLGYLLNLCLPIKFVVLK